MFVAIMKADPDNRVAKRADFHEEVDASAHVASFIDRFPDAFVIATPSEPEAHWLLDMAAKTIAIVPPPPPDYSAIDQAVVDRLLLESGVMRALATAQFQIINDVRALEGKNPITAVQYKDIIKGLIR